MSSVETNTKGVTPEPTSPPTETLDFNSEATVETNSKEPVASDTSSMSSPRSRRSRNKNKKKKQAAKETKEQPSSDADDLLPLPKKSSPTKLQVNTKVGSSIPLRTPADYQDFNALSLDFSALWDDVDWSDEEVSLTADDLRQRNKKRRRRMWRKLQVLASKKTLIDKKRTMNMGDTYRRDQNDQRRLSESTYTGLETHGTFREDLRSQSIVRRGWKTLLSVQNSSGQDTNLLDGYMTLTLKDLHRAASTRKPEDVAPARNLYLAIWNTLGNKPKTKMVAQRAKVMDDGPTLLWMLLTEYHGTAAQIIRQMRLKIDAFKDKVKAYGGDMDKFCEHVRKTMECLKSAGGSDDQAFDKIFEALVESHVQAFNESIRVWKTVCEQSSTPCNIPGLLNKARNEYQQLSLRKKWPKFSGTSLRHDKEDVPSRKRKHDSDIASLLAASEKRSEKRFNKQMKAMLASNSSSTRTTSQLGRTNKHSWDYQFGKGKDFPDRHVFLKWLHEKPENVTKSVIKNDLKWHWCTTCKRYTSHKTADCKKTPTKTEKASALLANCPPANATYVDDTDDENQDSDSGSSLGTYSAKKVSRSKTPSSP